MLFGEIETFLCHSVVNLRQYQAVKEYYDCIYPNGKMNSYTYNILLYMICSFFACLLILIHQPYEVLNI